MKSIKVQISNRDLAVFKYLFENKVASYEQINRDVFLQKDKSVVYRRLDKLVIKGFLKRVCIELKPIKLGFSITKKCLNEYIKPEFNPKYLQIKSHSIEHDLTLLEIQYLLKKCQKVTSYYTENSIQSGLIDDEEFPIQDFQEMRSDAGMKLTTTKEKYYAALEYEANCQLNKKYSAHFYNYYAKSKINIIFYICKNQKVLNILLKVENEILNNKTSKIYYTTLEKLKKENLKYGFTNYKNETIYLQ